MTTDQMWMLAMLVMFGLFLRGLQSEASRTLKTIAHDEQDAEWRLEMQLVMAQHQARERLRVMRQESARKEAERQARLRRARWERRCAEAIDESRTPAHERPALSHLSFSRVGDIIEEDELYGPFRLFGERIGHLGSTGGVERNSIERNAVERNAVERNAVERDAAFEPEFEPVFTNDFQRGGARLPVTRERMGT